MKTQKNKMNKKGQLAEIGIILIFIFIIFLIIVGIVLGVTKLEKISCKKTANKLGLEYSYSIWTECLIKTEKGFIPLDNYIEVKK